MLDAAHWIRYHHYRGGVDAVSDAVLRHIGHGILFHVHRALLEEHEDLPRLVSIDPTRLSVSTIPKHRFPHKGTNAFVGELGGVWDRFRKPVEDTKVYQSLHNRFNRDCQWEETELYQLARWKVEHREDETMDALEDRCASLDELFEDIRENGYHDPDGTIEEIGGRGDVEARGDGVRVGKYLVPDEPRIGIGRDGSFLRLGGGRHRIAIATMLDIETIPAVVLVQHPGYTGD